jgi:hypothetical protein
VRDVGSALNCIRAARQVARVVGPLVLLLGCTLISLHRRGQAGGCVDHDRGFDRCLAFGERKQHRSSARRETEQTDFLTGTQATRVLQRCDDVRKLARGTDDDGLEHQATEVLVLPPDHFFATTGRLTRAEQRQTEIDLQGRYVVERQSFHQRSLARRWTEPMPQQNRWLGHVRRGAQQRWHLGKSRFERLDPLAGATAIEAKALDGRMVSSSAIRASGSTQAQHECQRPARNNRGIA